MWTRERQRSAMSSEMLAHFANLKLAGDRCVRDAAAAISAATASAPSLGRAPRRNASSMPMRKRRRSAARRTGVRAGRRVHALSDADLEAELAQRRAIRSKEREKYARAMRSEKLSVLENELLRLRSEISRLDRGLPATAAGSPSASSVGAGTPHQSRWESLDGKGARPPSLNASAVPKRGAGPPPPSGGPPPPPPMPGLGPPGDIDEPIDPERQKREKAERQRRREAKRKEREANKKPMTIADIIKSAGPNPTARLKPKGSTPVPDVHDPQPEAVDEIAAMKGALKKTEKQEEKPTEKSEEGKEGAKEDAEKSGEAKSEKKDTDVAQGPSDQKKDGTWSENLNAVKDEKAAVPPPPPPPPAAAASSAPPKPPAPPAPPAPPGPPAPSAPATPAAVPEPVAAPAPPPPPPASKPNGTSESRKQADMDALSAVAALAAKLPKRNPSEGSTVSPTKPAGSQARLSMAEKRKRRREAQERAEQEKAGQSAV